MEVVVGRNVGARYQRRLRRYFEFAVVVSVVSLLGLGMLQRLAHLQGHVESLTLQSEVDTLRAALVLAAVREQNSLAPGSNPMELLEVPFLAYTGVAEQVDVETMEQGVWRFDQTAGALVYRIRHASTELPDNLPGRVLFLRIDGGHGDAWDRQLIASSH